VELTLGNTDAAGAWVDRGGFSSLGRSTGEGGGGFCRPRFVGYVDAFGFLDGRKCLIDWKTTSARYPDQPDSLLALDPQLVCYSWLTGEPEVAFVVIVH
jgi:hypothetical protein